MMKDLTPKMMSVDQLSLAFSAKYKEKVLSYYLPYMMETARSMKEENMEVKLYTLGHFIGDYDGTWGSINLDHPSTFGTLVMDLAIKKALIDD
ncbi:hypothetical protein Nepgr_029522 [Nepenthes gracilis]|uniref:Uncharacterized protein n=1 Tax=Nepenthes gracilis TaxID=150966 RepID=A0AAD3TEK1_NEPGR|nr:hypothetical protein Nepgr_029522 [Nepenthes gracilis]